jgi:hypothetical protein
MSETHPAQRRAWSRPSARVGEAVAGVTLRVAVSVSDCGAGTVPLTSYQLTGVQGR